MSRNLKPYISARAQHHVSDVSSDELEELASMLLKQLKETPKKHLDDDPEPLRVKIYSEAIAEILRISKASYS